MLPLYTVLDAREKLLEERERLRELMKKNTLRLNYVNGILERRGVKNFMNYDSEKPFKPIIDESKNNGFLIID
jgi:hypothetical protein